MFMPFYLLQIYEKSHLTVFLRAVCIQVCWKATKTGCVEMSACLKNLDHSSFANRLIVCNGILAIFLRDRGADMSCIYACQFLMKEINNRYVYKELKCSRVITIITVVKILNSLSKYDVFCWPYSALFNA